MEYRYVVTITADQEDIQNLDFNSEDVSAAIHDAAKDSFASAAEADAGYVSVAVTDES